MSIWIKLLLGYLLAINVAALIAFGADKWKARHKRRRIRESTLLLLAVLGGSPCAIAGMFLFRHKTLHKKFRIGLPLILIAQLLAVALLLWW